MLSLKAGYGAHIVGGEFELTYISGNSYRLALIQYRDAAQTQNTVIDAEVSARIFQKSDNRQMRDVVIPYLRHEEVLYTNVDCAIGQLKTLKVVYETTIVLSPNSYNDPEGYYVVWERCCRNAAITNIVNPNWTGQTYYLEFPPVVENGQPFRNSSPVLFPPLSDYAATFRPFYIFFGGTDPDGDSLVYSLVTPLNSTFNDVAVRPPSPRPYPPIQWANGISLENAIPGTPSLAVSEDGWLTVTPTNAGLYVFAVKCEEYRDKKKIGEVRRDFQMLVVSLPLENKPEIVARKKGSDVDYVKGEVLTFRYDEPKCLDIIVKDRDSWPKDENGVGHGQEKIRLRARPVNFTANLGDIFAVKSGTLTGKDAVLTTEVCFPDCPIKTKDGKPMMIDLIAADDACALPLLDTIRVTLNILMPENNAPFFVAESKVKTVKIREGEVFTLNLEGKDIDDDDFEFVVEPEGFELQTYGMGVKVIEQGKGKLIAEFNWDSQCEIYPFFQKDKFKIRFKVKDNKPCDQGGEDLLELNLEVELPANTLPEVTSDIEVDPLKVQVRIGQTLSFNVFAKDDDNDYLNLYAVGKDFFLDTYGATFMPKEGYGPLSSPFSWTITCDAVDLTKKDTFHFYFVANDNDRCKRPNNDTLKVEIKVLPPVNEPPIIYVKNNPSNEFRIEVGQKLSFEVEGLDPDNDNVTLSMNTQQGRGFRPDVQFFSSSGKGKASSLFEWTPGCDHLDDRFTPGVYEFEFNVQDAACFNQKSDNLIVKVIVEDIKVDYDFIAVNIFTPNKDGVNEYFSIPELPENNCASEFKSISIYNRYGHSVFVSDEKDFQWDGGNNPTGNYYYYIKYTHKDYKGWVTIKKQ
jgi:gliding motility-associated-like protein